MKKLALIIAILLSSICAHTQPIREVLPSEVGMDAAKLKQVNILINTAIKEKEFPGAVLAVVRYGQIAYLQAYGNKQLEPNAVKMTTNTVFDLASLTKPTATAISLMMLVEKGEIRLQDNVSFYIPDFPPYRGLDGKKTEIKLINLLTHTSGLPAYPPVNDLVKNNSGTPKGLLNYINTVGRKAAPTTLFIYSDLNYVLLQTIIEKVTKQSLQEFALANIFQPLGMTHTDFLPKGENLKLTAPTQKQKDGNILKGEVHDPLARILMDGVSGNAGLFSDARDLSILATMILSQGKYNGKQILAPLSIKAMESVPQGYEEFGRTLGWDSYSSFSTNQGDLFSKSTFGHTGYTGTSIIIDPEYYTAVIFLTNRVHPRDKGSQTRLRSLIANIVAGSIIEY